MKHYKALAETLPEWLTYAQASELAGGMSRDLLRYHIKKGEIAAIKRRIRFSSKTYNVLVNKESFIAFLERVESEAGHIPVAKSPGL